MNDVIRKTILITGATDGIGLLTAQKLAVMGHQVLLHGRNRDKLNAATQSILQAHPNALVSTFVADLSQLANVDALADAITSAHKTLDVLINNAGVLKTPTTRTADGLDIRFVVNALTPYRLTQKLLPLMNSQGRIINLSSAAQAPVNLEALNGKKQLADMEAYAQSKLAITMWSQHMAKTMAETGPAIIAVNPGSLLASKMVKEGFGIAGSDLNIGADILVQAALDQSFATANGKYYDNDAHGFAKPHKDADNKSKVAAVVQTLDALLVKYLGQ